jgi:hypothetical protein
MLIRSRSRNRARGGGSSLDNALLTLASYGASDAWDFVANQYIRNGTVGPSGITFTRASVGSYLNNNNTMTVFSSGQPRIGDKGILIEGSRQNLFLNSAVGATQSITVTAAAHTLSFFGTGTVTLSGVSTAGPLVGTGEFNRVPLTFTPTAGSLTLTVSGDIKWVNLELGSFPSSWIPSDGTAVTRAADAAVATISQGYPATIYGEYLRPQIGPLGILFQLDTNNTSNDRSILYLNAVNQIRGRITTAAGGDQMDNAVAGDNIVDTIQRAALRVQTNDGRAVRESTLSAQDTSVNLPATATRARFGTNASNAEPVFAYVRRAAIIPSALTDTQLQEITT